MFESNTLYYREEFSHCILRFMQIGFLTPSISTGINLILSKEPNEINMH